MNARKSDKGPNVGTSERWLLDVVTPEQLRAMLEARELVLRQRFERIIQEVTETRDQLLAVEFGAAAAGPSETRRGIAQDGDGEEPGDARQPMAEPGDKPVPTPRPIPPERQTSLQTLRVQRRLQNSRKKPRKRGRGRGVRRHPQAIDQQPHRHRGTEDSAEGPASPSRCTASADEMFPELDRRLERLAQHLGDQQLGPQQRDHARQQADAILLAMHKVLDRMIELEDFNEAVELLRTIIKLQEELDNQTQQRHKQNSANCWRTKDDVATSKTVTAAGFVLAGDLSWRPCAWAAEPAADPAAQPAAAEAASPDKPAEASADKSSSDKAVGRQTGPGATADRRAVQAPRRGAAAHGRADRDHRSPPGRAVEARPSSRARTN